MILKRGYNRVKYIFIWFYQNVGFEGNITSAMEFTDLAHFTFATWQMRSYSVNISPEATVVNVFEILRVFFVGLGN